MTDTIAMRAELTEAREMLELGGLTFAEERRLANRVGELERQLPAEEPPPPPATVAPPPTSELQEAELPPFVMPLEVYSRPALWSQLAHLNTELEAEDLEAEVRISKQRDRDRVARKLGIAA